MSATAIVAAAILALTHVSVLAGTAHASEEKSMIEREADPVKRRALNNWHHEMVQCWVYYNIAQEGLRRTGKKETAVAELQAVVDELSSRAYVLHRPETTLARMDLATTAMAREMHNDYVNISILLSKYGKLCKLVVEDTYGRFGYWYDKAYSEAQ